MTPTDIPPASGPTIINATEGAPPVPLPPAALLLISALTGALPFVRRRRSAMQM
jgi:hypothetical protein